YGAWLTISGEMESLAETGPSSDVSVLFFYPKAELLASGQGGLMETIHSLRLRLASVLAQALPQPQAALAQGVLLGLREDIPKKLSDSFIQSGTTHLLAISGLNISIFLGIMLSLGAWALGRQRPYYLILAFFGLWLYILLSGLNPPVIRAGIMGSLLLVGLWLGRPGASLTALAFAAALMTGIEPGLLYQVSFQLSFAATGGLILLSPYFQAWGRRVFLPQPVNDALAYSLGAIIASYPLVVYHFHILSIAGLPATLIAMPVLAPIILLSALMAVVGLFFPFLAQIIGWLDWLFLSYLQGVATTFASLPQAFIRVKEVSSAWLLVYYGALGLILFLLRPRLDDLLHRLKGK
ncbi:MAG: ComEC/Rec2 family competence protein, partial [Chloroflexota bacterium]